MIKENLLGLSLALLLLLIAIGNAVLIFGILGKAKRSQQVQSEAAVIRARQTALQGLLTDTVEYSRRNAAIEPILQSIGVRTRGAAATNAAPVRTSAK